MRWCTSVILATQEAEAGLQLSKTPSQETSLGMQLNSRALPGMLKTLGSIPSIENKRNLSEIPVHTYLNSQNFKETDSVKYW